MEAVAARAVRRDGGTVLRREAVVAFKKSFHAVGGQIVFRVQPLRRVATAADILGNIHRRTALERPDFMFIVTARAGRGVVRTGHDGLAMHARRPIARLLVVARAARLRLPRKINRRGRRVAGNHRVRIMAILARRRVVVPGLEREAVNTGIETFRLPRMTGRAVHQRHRFIVVGMFGRNVRVATDAGICLVHRRRELRLVHEQ